jgi:hypothetical protein
VNIGMALIVASLLGFVQGEWRGVSRRAVNVLLTAIAVLIVGMAVLAYAQSLSPSKELPNGSGASWKESVDHGRR